MRLFPLLHPAEVVSPPWGFRSPWLAAATRELNLRVVMWSLLPSDWRAPSAAWLIDRMQPIGTRAAANAKNATGAATSSAFTTAIMPGRTVIARIPWLPSSIACRVGATWDLNLLQSTKR